MKSLPSLLLLGLTSASFSQAPATKPPAAESTQKLPEVFITADKEKGYKADVPASVTRMPEAILDSARSVQVVTPQVMQDRAIVNPQDAIQTVSGVQRSSYNASGGETYLVRGFRQQNFLKDGFRAGTVPGANVISGAPPTDVANLQSVEVLKGPAAVEFGRGEPGGFVNYVTRLPDFEDSLSIQQQMGSFDFYRTQVNADVTVVPEVLALGLDLGYETGNAFIDRMDSERFFVAGSMVWNITPDTKLTWRTEYTNDKRTNTPGLPYLNGGVLAGVPTDRFFGEEDVTEYRTQAGRSLLQLEHRWNEAHKTTFSAHTMISQIEGGLFVLSGPPFAPALVSPAGNVGRATSLMNLNERNLTLRLDHLWTTTVAEGIKNELLLSAEFDYQRNDITRRYFGQATLNAFNPVYTGFTPLPIFGSFPVQSTDITAEAWSFMIMNRVSFGESVFLTLGVRGEWFDATNRSAASAIFGTSYNNLEQFYLNPSAGLVWKPAKNWSLYGSFAQSTFALQNIGSVTVGGEAIDPERSRQFEVGTKAEFLDGRLLASLAFFQIDKSNVAVPDTIPGFTRNGGNERTRGIEFDLNGEIVKGWNVSLNYAYLDSHVRNSSLAANSGQRRYGVPEHSGAIFTTYEVQEGKLRGLGLGGGVFLSDQVHNAPGATGTLPGYAQTDALVYYKLGKARLQLNVKNLFDNDIYFSQGQATMVNAAPGRTFLASVRYDF